MRWRFAGREEAAERAPIVARIDQWWAELVAHADDLDRSFLGGWTWDVPGFMQRTLQAIHPDLMWEFGPRGGGGHRLAISVQANCNLRPLVDEILRRAPALPNWELIQHRPGLPAEAAAGVVKARTGANLDELRFELRPGAHHRIDVMVHGRRAVSAELAAVAVWALVGDEINYDWLGEIQPARRGFLRSLFGARIPGTPAGELQRAVAEQIAAVREQLPAEPRYVWQPVESTEGDSREHIGWVFTRKPTPRDDYPAWLDLITASTAERDLWLASHANEPTFVSSRFSRHGECFAYLKIDGREGFAPGTFADRGELSDALDEVLRPAHLGATVGGGTGLIYSYIELALSDVDEAVAQIRAVLRAGRIHKRSWILFHDLALWDEWIGIWEDTPPPP